ncbi:hypothetical protein HNQ80_003480 [Anaerosolibacter carboniphilus]|uniref:DUF871 domain-containing protein n=1 Tax=Anaerosolibacter carboniphilus TaxID=1417629 RepID=A0A841KVA9_9FIRM|nr:MupG family TIM beta-alpha barrel fold protein [Anaerosolibacter carboniphilus]MBB6217361.1 hypothetical protein [Anaerosolibacter carboniphilus]
MIGISVFAGMGTSLEENLQYMQTANRTGIKYLFTSCHIPEARNTSKDELAVILKEASQLGMYIIMDISKSYFEERELEKYPIHSLRLDFGFSTREIAEMTRRFGFNITLNASTLEQEEIEKILEYGGEISKITACHNYYPRRDTGISEQLFVQRNNTLKGYGIKTMAFIPSQFRKRGPIYEGLPTLEKHREMEPSIAAQHLVRLGADIVMIGDAMASEGELKRLGKLRKEIMMIPIKLEKNIGESEKKLLGFIHTNRTDPGEYVIRSQEAREVKDGKIHPRNTLERYKNCVTIDNDGYKRYEGELQILKKEMAKDDRVNVVADASSAEILVHLLQPGEKFVFEIMEDEA